MIRKKANQVILCFEWYLRKSFWVICCHLNEILKMKHDCRSKPSCIVTWPQSLSTMLRSITTFGGLVLCYRQCTHWSCIIGSSTRLTGVGWSLREQVGQESFWPLVCLTFNICRQQRSILVILFFVLGNNFSYFKMSWYVLLCYAEKGWIWISMYDMPCNLFRWT